MSAPAEFLSTLVTRFRPQAAQNLCAVYQLHLTGHSGGTWRLIIADQQCRLSSGPTKNPDVAITMTADDFQQLAAGRLDALSAYVAGRIRIVGSISLVARLQSLFDL